MKRLSEEALRVLGNIETNDRVAFLREEVDRKLYLEVNKALEALGGKWDRKRKGHIFDEDPQEGITQVVNNGGFVDKKQELGFFQTPVPVIEMMVKALDIQPNHRVLEPSAGAGRMVRVLAEQGRGCDVTAIEIQPQRMKDLEAAAPADGITILIRDFLTLGPSPDDGLFDRVLMNPPFAKQADIDHVMHALTFLKPGGRLAAIMSAGVKFRNNSKTKDFRQLVESCGGVINDLPGDTFKAEGTGVSTVVVYLTKPSA